jgi:HPt (histidine-containing phosphotransfer) domain-containing protein
MDFGVIESIGHNLRGNGISFGFPDLSALGERLELAAKQKRPDRIREQLAALVKWTEEARQGAAPSGTATSPEGQPSASNETADHDDENDAR